MGMKIWMLDLWTVNSWILSCKASQAYAHHCMYTPKGDLISEQICEDIDFPNCNKNIARISALKMFMDLGVENLAIFLLQFWKINVFTNLFWD